MNTLDTPSLERIRRRCARVIGAALIVTVGVALSTRAGSFPAYRFLVFAAFAPALGAMIFALLHRTTGGQWGDALEPILISGANLVPWICLLLAPLVFASPPEDWPQYASRLMLLIRIALAAVIFFFLAAKLRQRATWVGPVGLIALVLTLHVLAEDWLMSLTPRWHSTGFPLVWMTGVAVTGLACAILASEILGISPAGNGRAARALGLDWGNLLLATTLVWCYLAFTQYLIIWSGNLPRELAWHEERSRGAWSVVPGVLAVVHFVVPLAVLLSRDFKQSKSMLTFCAALLVGAQLLYLAWIVLPMSDANPLATAIASVAGGAGALAFFFHGVLRSSRQAQP